MKKCFCIVLIVLTLLLSCVGIYAAEFIPEQSAIIAEAIIAGVACPEHSVENCSECEGYELFASYTRYCPLCDKKMTRCCNDTVAVNDMQNTCNVDSHPDGCVNIQDWCRNIYVCSDCNYYTTGPKEDDIHLEAYYHTRCNCTDGECSDNSFCTLPRLSNYINEWESDIEVMSSTKEYADKYTEAVVAGDYCETHGRFACDIVIDTKAEALMEVSILKDDSSIEKGDK